MPYSVGQSIWYLPAVDLILIRCRIEEVIKSPGESYFRDGEDVYRYRLDEAQPALATEDQLFLDREAGLKELLHLAGEATKPVAVTSLGSRRERLAGRLKPNLSLPVKLQGQDWFNVLDG